MLLSRYGLQVQCFDEWNQRLDEALSALPEAGVATHDVFRYLMQNQKGQARKRAVLMNEAGVPVALVGLRSRADHWEPVTHWIIPGFLFPVKEGYVGRALSAVGHDTVIGWYRWSMPPPTIRGMRDVKTAPTYGINCSDDFEAHWKKSNRFWRNLANIRNRCRAFELRVNSPGMATWTITSWKAKWHPKVNCEMPDLSDRLIAASCLERRGLHYVLSLHDNGAPIAGITFVVHNTCTVAQVNYRVPEYDKYGVMTRLMELSFHWARETGFKTMDWGGSHDYKKKWAPEAGQKWQFRVCPNNIWLSKTLIEALRRAKHKAKAVVSNS